MPAADETDDAPAEEDAAPVPVEEVAKTEETAKTAPSQEPVETNEKPPTGGEEKS